MIKIEAVTGEESSSVRSILTFPNESGWMDDPANPPSPVPDSDDRAGSGVVWASELDGLVITRHDPSVLVLVKKSITLVPFSSGSEDG